MQMIGCTSAAMEQRCSLLLFQCTELTLIASQRPYKGSSTQEPAAGICLDKGSAEVFMQAFVWISGKGLQHTVHVSGLLWQRICFPSHSMCYAIYLVGVVLLGYRWHAV